MATSRWRRLAALLLLLALAASNAAFAADGPTPAGGGFPPALDSYGDPDAASLTAVLQNRVAKQPFNLVATLLFLGAIVHTFLTHKFRHYSHVLEERHQARIRGTGRTAAAKGYEGAKDDVSFGAAVFHFLGEVEAVFGLWVVPLLIAMFIQLGSGVMLDYVNHRAGYNEPIFVVIIMAMSATRPVLRLAENLMRHVSGLGGGGPAAWWMTILTLGPLLGSFITEPAAMTISASLLGVQFYRLKPSPKFAYATLGLLFVNVSVGGTLTHFAAPPVLMVAGRWNWDLAFMFQHFGWQAALGIVAANLAGLAAFRKELAALAAQAAAEGAPRNGLQESIPVWVTASHLLFMSWSVLNAHYPAMLIGGFLFFLAFHQATEQYQHRMELRSPILVGFFLAGLVVHGGLQGWWIEPVLRRLNEFPLFVGAAGLTAFNDNAAITYLATLVPGLTDGMKHAIVAGAVVGGGLTVIANAPNPAGQAILGRYFKEGISPLGLLLGALVPTLVVGATMWLLR
jgi:hypothetical protein